MTARETTFLPYGRHLIEDDDVDAVADALRSGVLTGGPAVARFEEAFAAAVGARRAVVCANGTAALHLAALVLDLTEGDRVVVPTLTFLATANAARYVGAEVVFADVDSETGLMGPEHLEEAIARAGTPAPRAVFPVHISGHPCDIAGIAEIAGRAGLTVVEDACHALGGVASGAPVGACGHSTMACFSMHPVKTIAMGEGGAVTTNDEALADRLSKLRSHGITREAEEYVNADLAFGADGLPNPWYYEMPEMGFNYRASDINCALGLNQLGKLPRFLGRRRVLADLYDRLLAPLAPVVRPVSRSPHGDSGWHLYVVRIDFDALGMSRAPVMRALSERGIGTQVHYIPVHRQPYYRRRYGDMQLPGADAYYAHALSLPLFPSMADADAERVVAALAEVLRKEAS